jgi:RimJ/RimL family protein N-acetyltransferase
VTHRILTAVKIDAPVLRGEHIRLEPLDRSHIGGLIVAASADPSLYRWTPVPQGKLAATTYVEIALAWRDAGTSVPFAIVRKNDNFVMGSTRFFNLDRWAWPEGHPRHGVALDACEIGYTWLTSAAIRTATNTEAKLLMLTHAFESWHALRVCFHTDTRNQQSRNALERLGAKFEGILRSHRMAADFIPRDSVCYSIVVAEWPDAKQRLTQFLDQPRSRAESTQG